jgi:hypothetical protein
MYSTQQHSSISWKKRRRNLVKKAVKEVVVRLIMAMISLAIGLAVVGLLICAGSIMKRIL